MLSKEIKGGKLLQKKALKALPELERPLTVRLKFRKTGSLQYISHLDLQRTFNRVISRACLPVWYTKGFNPHIKLIFSTPLSIGAQSVCEYLDIKIDREMTCEEIMKRLNAELTDELYIMDAYFPSRDFSEIAGACYDVEIYTFGANEEMAKKIQSILTTSPVMLTKKTKSGEKEIDIIPLIYSVNTVFDSEHSTIKISCVLSASSTEYLNPEMLITALKQKLGILSGNAREEWYSIMRTELLKQDMTKFE